MGRQIRIEYENALYHVMAHGNGFQWIYKNEEHIGLFKKILINIIRKYKVKIHAVVLMRNHYHILIETPHANLSKCMKKFNQDFARMFNNTTGRKGSVFRDRYKAILIEKESYFFNVLRYICQNPVRKKIVSRCEDYPGSYLSWIKDRNFFNTIFLDTIIEKFSDNDDNEEWYSNFINWLNSEIEPKNNIKTKFKYLFGTENWTKNIKEKFKKYAVGNVYEKKKYYEINIDDEKLRNVLNDKSKKEKLDILVYIYAKYSGLSISEICSKFKMASISATGQRYYRIKKQIIENIVLKNEIRTIEEKCLNC